MNCKYIYNGKTFNSYDDLVNFLRKVENLINAESILYSLDDTVKRDQIRDKILKLSKEANFAKSSALGDSVDIQVGANTFTT